MDHWTAWRREFPILTDKTYLNSCSLGAFSHRAEGRVAEFHEEWHRLGASAWYDHWLDRLDELRELVADLLGADASEIGLAPNVSTALTVIASALVYRERPRVIVTELDFPTLAYQWMARPDVEVVRVPSDDGATIEAARIANAVDERTALLATSHVFFTTGAIQDLRELSEIAHANGALILVDAYQGAGQVPIDVHKAGVDILLAGSLKWLLGGPGLAYLYVRRALTKRLTPTTAGWLGTDDPFSFDLEHLAFRDDAGRFELGTPSLPSVHAALGGQSIINEVGVARIRERNRALTERLVARTTDAGFRLRVAPDPDVRSAIVMIAHNEPEAAVAYLADQGIIVDARPGHVRVSPHFYNTEEEIDGVTDELAAWSGR